MSSKKKLVAVGSLAAIGGLVIGAAIGATPGGAAEADTAPKPQPTVTVTAEPEPVIMEVTPQVCLDAFDQVGTMVGEMSVVIEKVGPALEAAATWDVAALEAFTSGIEASNERIEAISPSAKADIIECKSLAEAD